MRRGMRLNLPCLLLLRVARRLARSGLHALLWCLAATVAPPAWADNILSMAQALTAVGDTAQFPLGVPTQTVTLPDDWSDTRPGVVGPVWYRVAFDAPGVQQTGQLLALYVERACANIEIQLNGQRVYVGGSMRPPLTRNCHRPQLAALPAAMVQPTGNVLDVKLVGDPLPMVASRQRAAGLSPLQLGPFEVLQAQHARRTALAVGIPQVGSGVLLLLGVFMIVMGGLNRRDSHLAYFGALCIGWSIVTARLWLQHLPVPGYDAELLLVSFMPFVALAAVQFLLRYGGLRLRPIDAALYAQCVVVPLSLLLAGSSRLYTTATTWYALLCLEVLLAMGVYLTRTWRKDRGRFKSMAIVLAAAAGLAVLELAGQQQLISPALLALSHGLLPVVFVALGLQLMQQYGKALQTAELSRQTLESRVRDATEQIERNFAQLAELRVEQVTERERKRIAADLHDDLGAKLLTIVHTSESDRISTLAREALEEMRLSVRGLTGKPVQLIDALGDWRAEVMSRLSQTGIESDWAAPAEELPQMLSARAYVQTTRILREAVNNIIKHSGASHCAITCAIETTDFRLVIQDNGKGIPLELDGRLDRGHGMSSMKHRAKQLHGQCLVESGPGYGTVIRLTIPLDRHTANA